MMTTAIKRLFMVMMAITSLAIISCKTENFDEPPNNTPDPGLPTISIRALRDSFPGGLPYTLSGDVTIKGIVVADDKSGNLYKQIVIDDGTAGMTVLIDRADLYTDYPVGRLIYIKCKGLILGNYHNFLQLGGFIDNSSGQPAVGNIPEALMTKFIVKGPTGNDVAPLITTRTITSLNDSFQSRLVNIEDVEFTSSDADKPWADIVNQQSLSRIITDCGGKTAEVRSSNFANFANKNTPRGNGTIIGVYSVYNSTKQLTIRDTTDADMMGIKCDGSDPNAVVIFSENFNGISDPNNTVISLSGWQNINEVGPNKFKVGKFSTVVCAKADMFSISTGGNSTQWFITPAINLTGYTTKSLTFTSAAGFDNGAATFSALISTNYDGGTSPQSFTWTTLPATIATGPSSGFGSFISSGNVDLSSYSGNVYIAFKYVGVAPATTYEFDDLKVTGLP